MSRGKSNQISDKTPLSPESPSPACGQSNSEPSGSSAALATSLILLSSALTMSGCGLLLDVDRLSQEAETDPCRWFRDSDGDGHGDPSDERATCSAPDGYVARADDCDDADARLHPSARELCDGRDNDCDPTSEDYCPPFCEGFSIDQSAYMLCLTPESFSHARQACESANMSLVRIDNRQENDSLTAQFGSLLYAWIGASDTDQEGTWLWEDGTTFWEEGQPADDLFSAWYAGEPSTTTDQDCGELWHDGTWNAEDCTREQAYLCEAP